MLVQAMTMALMAMAMPPPGQSLPSADIPPPVELPALPVEQANAPASLPMASPEEAPCPPGQLIRIDSLEKRVTAQANYIRALEQQAKTLKARIVALSGNH